MGYADLDDKDIDILKDCLGNDGKITLNDLEQIFKNEF